MSEKEFNEREYIDGFNQGYIMTKYAPEMQDLISFAQGSSDRFDGLRDGQEQYFDDLDAEKEPDRSLDIDNDNIPDALKNNRYDDLFSDDRDIDIDLDKD